MRTSGWLAEIPVQLSRRIHTFVREIPTQLRQAGLRRCLLVVAGCLVCVHAIGVLAYILSMPDLGLRSAFGLEIRTAPRFFLPDQPGGLTPRGGDTVLRIGDEKIDSWPELLGNPRRIQDRLGALDRSQWPTWAKRERHDGHDLVLIRTEFERTDPETHQTSKLVGWCALGSLSVEELVPTTLWFLLKLTLFVVGALVLWKRPNDPAASQFFLLCIVTVGAYMGGYHWTHIAPQPLLLVGFMICGVLLPVVSLQFYLVFPRPKPILVRHPRWTLLAIYGVPLACLVTLIVLYFRARWFYHYAKAPPTRLARPSICCGKPFTSTWASPPSGIWPVWWPSCTAIAPWARASSGNR